MRRARPTTLVSSRLGHATVAFTLDSYSADIPDLDQEAAEDIGVVPAEDRGGRLLTV
ncbi:MULTISPECIES: hypothetical protein [unclassified Saccharothrix]|uniref:hypothetical protein n=1 Tax=unclassified Saccharothrix TaxID=2593673 RepID=UPI00307F655B